MISCVVVDDDLLITRVFSDILSLMGLDVVATGHDGNDAVTLYRQYKPDILFVDMHMPKYDGLYAIKKIKEFDPDSKIVAVTGDYFYETQQKLKELCVTAIIYKPFEQSQIKRILLEEYKIKTQ